MYRPDVNDEWSKLLREDPTAFRREMTFALYRNGGSQRRTAKDIGLSEPFTYLLLRRAKMADLPKRMQRAAGRRFAFKRRT